MTAAKEKAIEILNVLQKRRRIRNRDDAFAHTIEAFIDSVIPFVEKNSHSKCFYPVFHVNLSIPALF